MTGLPIARAAQSSASRASPTSPTSPRTILVFGDSLSAGHGIAKEAAWPTLLARRLQDQRLDYSVVNASISGETSAGGRTRLDAALDKYKPSIVIIALGSNDGLRGLPVATLRDNLNAMIDSAGRSKARVLLVGQRIPPNYGAYAESFQKVFGDVAKDKKVALIGFLLEGVGARADYFQADNLHPNAAAQPILLDTVWRGLVPLLK